MQIKNIAIVLTIVLTSSCADPSSGGEPVPDAGTEQKVLCRQCELYCNNVCYKKRYDNTLACTNDAYYSYCRYRCGVDIDALPELCIPQYLDLQTCIINARSPAYICQNGQPTLREPSRCFGAAFALSYCKSTAPY